MRKNVKSKLYLIGAGPGDPDLITVKGLKKLQDAQVVLYDALVHPDLIQNLPESTLKIYVGKRQGQPSKSQDEINKLILELVIHFDVIIRLKGGDPFVFGRGHEELEFAEKHGIEVEIIPGLSSAIAVPGNFGIPVTKRGISESFWVVTGCTKNHEISQDLYLAAKSTATIVVLMGTRTLDKIIDLVLKYRNAETAVALLQNGTYREEKSIYGKLKDIKSKAIENKFCAPGIVVIGEVVQNAVKTIPKGVLELSK